MAAKILNLDKLAAEKPARELVLKGVTYAIPDMTVENFILTTRDAERLQKEKLGLADQIEATIEMITRCVPDLTTDKLRGYALDELGQIAAFCRGEDPPEEKANQAPAAGKEEAGKK